MSGITREIDWLDNLDTKCTVNANDNNISVGMASWNPQQTDAAPGGRHQDRLLHSGEPDGTVNMAQHRPMLQSISNDSAVELEPPLQMDEMEDNSIGEGRSASDVCEARQVDMEGYDDKSIPQEAEMPTIGSPLEEEP